MPGGCGWCQHVRALLPILPLALMPPDVGRAAFLLLSLAGFGYAAFKLGAKLLPAGAFLVVVDPQIGSMVALFCLVESWRKGGWREVLRVFWPVSLALLLSFALFGLRPFRCVVAFLVGRPGGQRPFAVQDARWYEVMRLQCSVSKLTAARIYKL